MTSYKLISYTTYSLDIYKFTSLQGRLNLKVESLNLQTSDIPFFILIFWSIFKGKSFHMA